MNEPADLDVHLATCAGCAGELARYREVLSAVSSLRNVLEEAPAGLPERVVAAVVGPEVRSRRAVDWLVRDRKAHVAAASVGGALVGAGAVALVWWRAAKRAMAGAGSAVLG